MNISGTLNCLFNSANRNQEPDLFAVSIPFVPKSVVDARHNIAVLDQTPLFKNIFIFP